MSSAHTEPHTCYRLSAMCICHAWWEHGRLKNVPCEMNNGEKKRRGKLGEVLKTTLEPGETEG